MKDEWLKYILNLLYDISLICCLASVCICDINLLPIVNKLEQEYIFSEDVIENACLSILNINSCHYLRHINFSISQ